MAAYKPGLQIKVVKKQKVHHVRFTFQTEFQFDTFCAMLHALATAHPTNAYFKGISDLLDKADKDAD